MPEKARKGQSLWRDAWRRLRKNRFAMAGLVVMVVVTLASVIAPWITPMAPDYGQPWLRYARAPGFEHPAVLAEIRYDKGDAPFVPERIPPIIADYLSTDGTIRYTLTEVTQNEYRVRLRGRSKRTVRQSLAQQATILEPIIQILFQQSPLIDSGINC